MNSRMINVGFGNSVVASRVLLVVNPKSSPIKKLKDEAKLQKKLIDVTEGRKTRAILFSLRSNQKPSIFALPPLKNKMRTDMKGNLIIISAPSGTGKTTILKKIMPHLNGLTFSVSHTTRSPRQGEEDGKDYHFVNTDAFLALRDQGGFLEWAEVHGNFYGTSKNEVDATLEDGHDVFLDIDIQGARQVRTAAPDAISIFVSPPSWQEQEKRLNSRGTDSPETIALRLANAKAEMADVDLYDYVVMNDDLDTAARMFEAIILAMRAKNRRDVSGAPLNVPEGQ